MQLFHLYRDSGEWSRHVLHDEASGLEVVHLEQLFIIFEFDVEVDNVSAVQRGYLVGVLRVHQHKQSLPRSD